MPFRKEHRRELLERRDVNRVTPFRKGIVRCTATPVQGPQPVKLALDPPIFARPLMRGANPGPCPFAPLSGLLLASRHG